MCNTVFNSIMLHIWVLFIYLDFDIFIKICGKRRIIECLHQEKLPIKLSKIYTVSLIKIFFFFSLKFTLQKYIHSFFFQ